MNQNIPDDYQYEIIIIDSGNDDTEKMVTGIMSQKTRGQIVYKKVKGSTNRSKIRNKGAHSAKYDIVCFLDNDMLVPPSFVLSHISYHLKNRNSVYMGIRQSLTEFQNSADCASLLTKDFSSLSLLPCFNDDRTAYFSARGDFWRFFYSHNVSLEKKDFLKSHGFDTVFGRQWGCEDLELGFRLSQQGLSFFLDKSLILYHQPHFSQSMREQSGYLRNLSLFIEKHNCYESELFLTFPETFDVWSDSLQNLQKKRNGYLEKRRNELFLGCLFTKEQKHDPYYRLGLLIPENLKFSSLTILSEFFSFPLDMQLAVLSSAVSRISRFEVEKDNAGRTGLLYRLMDTLGYSVEIDTSGERYVITLNARIKPKILTAFLPDVFSPQKRVMCLTFVSQLKKKGWEIVLRDIRGTRAFEDEDYACDFYPEFADSVDRVYGSAHSCSFGLYSLDDYYHYKNTNAGFVVDDVEFTRSLPSGIPLPFCKHVPETDWGLLFLDALLQMGIPGPMPEKKNQICLFMENGYLEDGMDIVLDAVKQSGSQIAVVIKMPDYEKLRWHVYAKHNESSKLLKSASVFQKWHCDELLLKQKIEELGLAGNVTIIKENMSLKDVCTLLAESEMYISASRLLTVSPESLIARLYGTKTVIGKHQRSTISLLKSCAAIDSVPCRVFEEFHLSAHSDTVSLYCHRMDRHNLAETISQIDDIPGDAYNAKELAAIHESAEMILTNW